MYFGESLMSESYLDNLYKYSQLILNDNKFMYSLTESSNGNIITRFVNWVKEKIDKLIEVIIKIKDWIAEKVFKRTNNIKKENEKLKSEIKEVINTSKNADEVISELKETEQQIKQKIKETLQQQVDQQNKIQELIQNSTEYKKLEAILNNNEFTSKLSSESKEQIIQNVAEKFAEPNKDEALADKKIEYKGKIGMLINNDDKFEFISVGELICHIIDNARICKNSFMDFKDLIESSIEDKKSNYNYEDFICRKIYKRMNFNTRMKEVVSFESLNEYYDSLLDETWSSNPYQVAYNSETIYKRLIKENMSTICYNTPKQDQVEAEFNKFIDHLNQYKSDIEKELTKNHDNDDMDNKFYKNSYSLIGESIKVVNYLFNVCARCYAKSANYTERAIKFLEDHIVYI